MPINYTYHEVSTKISSILKEAGVPLSNKQIQEQLLNKYNIDLKLANLKKIFYQDYGMTQIIL